ncbi:ead/Ea22-like family protein [Escherichia coli]|uniref:ead/Ea22-like family protein n=1 Tax=Escherichia coli TaxID=562 RepID=UPI0029700DAA|nr:hypothetical protein [Escherichia coli]
MTNKQELREAAESTIGILENIAGFEPSDIDGDTVELRFETDGGFDTGCDVSIVDQCQKSADVVRALLDELEAAEKRIAELEARAVALPLPRRKIAADYVDDVFEPCDLAAVYNACRLECEVKFKNALVDAGVKVVAAAGKGE